MSKANAERPQTRPYRHKPFRIRAAQRRDLPAIVAVLLQSFYPKANSYPWLYWLLRIGITEDIKTRMSTPVYQYSCLVATLVNRATQQAGDVIGTAEISQRPCETWRLFPPKRAYISNLAIHPNHRRQGAAQQLMESCENIAIGWGFRRLYLHVMANNTAAMKLYTQVGYRRCEVSNPILSRLGLRPERVLLTKSLSQNL